MRIVSRNSIQIAIPTKKVVVFFLSPRGSQGQAHHYNRAHKNYPSTSQSGPRYTRSSYDRTPKGTYHPLFKRAHKDAHLPYNQINKDML